MSGRRLLVLVVVLTAVIGGSLLVRPYAHGLTFVIREAGMHGVLRSLADLDADEVTERKIDITTSLAAHATLVGRLYSPTRRPRRMALLVSGLHPSGIDEPRLVGLARELAASGVAVVTPDIPELSSFEITPAVTDEIEAAALWLSELSESDQANSPVRHERIGLMGISFSGGLSVVAAGRPALRDRLAYVFSLGGHDDLPRVLRYLCTGVEPQPASQLRLKGPSGADDPGTPAVRPPHDYGVAMILLGVAHRLVPPRQLEPLRGAVRRFLQASALDRLDKPRAEQEFAALRALATMLPEPSATLLRYVNDRDVIHLGSRVLPYVELFGAAPPLSPSKSPKPSAPVFLLHGRDDNVIPAMESEYLAEDVRAQGLPRVLLSRLISHADIDHPPRLAEVMELASFWGDLLAR